MPAQQAPTPGQVKCIVVDAEWRMDEFGGSPCAGKETFRGVAMHLRKPRPRARRNSARQALKAARTVAQLVSFGADSIEHRQVKIGERQPFVVLDVPT